MTGYELSESARAILPLKWGYIWGTSGELWTAEKQAAATRKQTKMYGSRWVGHHVADCSGLIVYLCKKAGISVPHGSNSMWDKGLSEKGEIAGKKLPDGALVFKLRDGDDYYHVGVYVGNGKVVEAKSTFSGVVESKLSAWTHYGLLKGISYTEGADGLKVGSAVVDVPNNGSVNVRAGSSTTSAKQDTLKEGDACEILSISGEWAKVEYKKTGYIMTRFLRNTTAK